MIINVDEIGPSGLEKSEKVPAEKVDEWLQAAGEAEWTAEGEGTFHGRFTKLGKKVLMNATGSFPLKSGCARCLKPVSVQVDVDFTISFTDAPCALSGPGQAEPKKLQDESGTGASFDLLSADEEPYDGREVDTDGVLSQEMLLELPMTPLCDEDCKGLCSVCGADLNQGECGCQRKPMDPRWAALKNIKIAPKPD